MKTITRITASALLTLLLAAPAPAIGPRNRHEGGLLTAGAPDYFRARPAIIDIPVQPAPVRSSGMSRALVLLVDFDDKPAQVATYTPEYFRNRLFGSGQGSMRSYFEENSYGAFSVTGDVYGWFRSGCRHADIVNRDGIPGTGDDYGLDTSSQAIDESICDLPLNIWGLVVQTVELAGGQVDFAQYDNDGPDGIPDSGDDDGYVDALIVFHSGVGAEIFLDAGLAVNYIWSLQSDLDRYEPTRSTSVQGIKIGQFVLVAEMGGMGVFAHEFGHLLGLPDLYNSETGTSVVGNLCLMDDGAWNGPFRDASVPSHLCAPMKHILGWVEPERVCFGCEGVDSVAAAVVEPHGTKPRPYQVLGNEGGMDWTASGTGRGEYFMIENRQRTEGHFEAYLDGSGLVIWKFDESRTDNNDPEGRLAEVIQADGEIVVDGSGSYDLPGEASDFWPGSLGKRDFTPRTEPSSNLSGGRFSGVSVTNITEGLSHTITADIKVGLPRKGAAYAYPNPYRLAEASPMRIVFVPEPGPDTPFPGTFEVLIFDLEGNLVRKLEDAGEILDDGTALWNGRDETGNEVDPGLYFYSARSSGQEATGVVGIKK
jgi:immune inhibitor A